MVEPGGNDVVGRHPSVLRALELARKYAGSDFSVLILGETGTGKDLFASRIHRESRRKSGPFVVIDCAALGRELSLSELFGHRKGSFTGADLDRQGLVASADGGTLFLDEVGELDPVVQGHFLRLLQDYTYRSVGDQTRKRIDVRMIAATNRDLVHAVALGEFRDDLYHRLDVLRLDLPPLRLRRSDVRDLVPHFIREDLQEGRKAPAVSREAIDVLTGHHWPGNVRELRNVIRRLLAVCDKTVGRDQVLEALAPGAIEVEEPLGSLPYKTARRISQNQFTREYFEEVLARTNGNVTQAARESGIRRQYLQERLTELGIEVQAYRTRQDPGSFASDRGRPTAAPRPTAAGSGSEPLTELDSARRKPSAKRAMRLAPQASAP